MTVYKAPVVTNADILQRVDRLEKKTADLTEQLHERTEELLLALEELETHETTR